MWTIPEGRKQPRIDSEEVEELQCEGDYLYEYFIEIVSAGSNVISFSELQSWQESRGIILTPWEIDTLQMMFKAHRIMQQEAKDLGCFSPLMTEQEQMIARQKSMIEHLKRMSKK